MGFSFGAFADNKLPLNQSNPSIQMVSMFTVEFNELFNFKNAVLEKNIISRPIDSHHQFPINKPVSRSNKFELIELIESLKYKIERFV